MLNEIGSEYWDIETTDRSEKISEVNHGYTLSGRTSIDFIIKDIKVNSEVQSVYIPSYCCHTMIEPFISNSIEVIFYNVNFINNHFTYDIDYDTQCDILLIMNYFGFNNYLVNQIIDRFNKKGTIIIEDATHSWFSSDQYSLKSDYVLASLRKWTGLPCGSIIIKRSSNFVYDLPIKQNFKYTETRQKAATLKKEYINNKLVKKEIFLELFNDAEAFLESDYKEYTISDKTYEIIHRLDYRKIKDKRKLNAGFLIDELKRFNEIETVSFSDVDTPLFVPIIVSGNKRDELRRFLIRNKVYCPVHWPVSKLHKISNYKLYDNILSIICDQRYGVSDMKRIITLIYKFFGGY